MKYVLTNIVQSLCCDHLVNGAEFYDASNVMFSAEILHVLSNRHENI